jgi:hypothetical protein
LIELDAHASVNLHKSTSKPKNRSCYLNKKKIEAPLATRIYSSVELALFCSNCERTWANWIIPGFVLMKMKQFLS